MPRPKLQETREQVVKRQRMAVLIRTLRAVLGWSQRDLAALVGVHYTTIAKLEQGTLRLNEVKLAEILSLFEASGLRFRQTPAIEVTADIQVLNALDPEHGLILPLPEPGR